MIPSLIDCFKTSPVTARVVAAAGRSSSAQAALEARKAQIAQIEKESLDRTGLRSDVVALYQGAQYWLYRYKKYTDVRLVFAPEQQMAFFGGDPDNFTYPRYDLDVSFFRVYENGQPLKTENYLPWSPAGAKEGAGASRPRPPRRRTTSAAARTTSGTKTIRTGSA